MCLWEFAGSRAEGIDARRFNIMSTLTIVADTRQTLRQLTVGNGWRGHFRKESKSPEENPGHCRLYLSVEGTNADLLLHFLLGLWEELDNQL